jgi:hypothetical protein
VKGVRHEKYHGRIGGERPCAAEGCDEAGEFRAPGGRGPSFDGPGEYRWLCLDHVRAFNRAYDFFEGMSAEEILEAQHPVSGWASESRAFSAAASVDAAPRWGDFADPLEAISARARARQPQAREDGRILTGEQRKALDKLGLGYDAGLKEVRQRYSTLVRKYHPDRNGGDRSFETRLQQVVEAYRLLRDSRLFA